MWEDTLSHEEEGVGRKKRAGLSMVSSFLLLPDPSHPHPHMGGRRGGGVEGGCVGVVWCAGSGRWGGGGGSRGGWGGRG